MALAEKKPWPDPKYFFAAPTRPQAKHIAWEDLKALVPSAWLADEPNESELVIKTHFGSELRVIGMDKPQRAEGVAYDGGIEDETCDQKPGSFDRSLYPALADRNGWCWRTGVPKRTGPSAAEVRKRAELAVRGELPDWAYFHWKSADILPAEAIETAKATLDPKTYREQYEASWESAGGAIYDAFVREYNVRPCLYHPELPILIGSDFNVSPMAWVLCHLYGTGNAIRLEVFDELWIKDTNTRRTLDELWRRYEQHKGGWQFYGDATSSQRRTSATLSDYQIILADDRFRQAGRTVHYPRSNPARADRYASVNVACCNAHDERRLFVDPRCVHLIEDLEQVYYDPGTREAAQVGDLTHISDALGYICYRKFPVAGVRVVQDARFGV